MSSAFRRYINSRAFLNSPTRLSKADANLESMFQKWRHRSPVTVLMSTASPSAPAASVHGHTPRSARSREMSTASPSAPAASVHGHTPRSARSREMSTASPSAPAAGVHGHTPRSARSRERSPARHQGRQLARLCLPEKPQPAPESLSQELAHFSPFPRGAGSSQLSPSREP